MPIESKNKKADRVTQLEREILNFLKINAHLEATEEGFKEVYELCEALKKLDPTNPLHFTVQGLVEVMSKKEEKEWKGALEKFQTALIGLKKVTGSRVENIVESMMAGTEALLRKKPIFTPEVEASINTTITKITEFLSEINPVTGKDVPKGYLTKAHQKLLSKLEKMLIDHKRYELLDPVIEALITCDPKNPKWLVDKANLLIGEIFKVDKGHSGVSVFIEKLRDANGQQARAKALFEKATKLDPHYAPALAKCAYFAYVESDIDKALSLLQTAVNYGERQHEVYELVGFILETSKLFVKDEKRREEVKDRAIGWLGRISFAFSLAGEFKRAKEQVELVLKWVPDHERALEIYSELFIKLEQFKECIADEKLQKAAFNEKEPALSNKKIALDRLHALIKEKQFSEAESLCKAWRGSRPSEGEFQKGLEVVYLGWARDAMDNKHDYDLALHYCDAVLAMNPAHTNALWSKIECLNEQGKLQETIHTCDQLLSLQLPKAMRLDTLFIKADFMHENKEYGASIEILKELLSLQKGNIEAQQKTRLLLSRNYVFLQNPFKAHEAIRPMIKDAAFKNKPEFLALRAMIARLSQDRQEYDKIVQMFKVVEEAKSKAEETNSEAKVRRKVSSKRLEDYQEMFSMTFMSPQVEDVALTKELFEPSRVVEDPYRLVVRLGDLTEEDYQKDVHPFFEKEGISARLVPSKMKGELWVTITNISPAAAWTKEQKERFQAKFKASLAQRFSIPLPHASLSKETTSTEQGKRIEVEHEIQRYVPKEKEEANNSWKKHLDDSGEFRKRRNKKKRVETLPETPQSSPRKAPTCITGYSEEAQYKLLELAERDPEEDYSTFLKDKGHEQEKHKEQKKGETKKSAKAVQIVSLHELPQLLQKVEKEAKKAPANTISPATPSIKAEKEPVSTSSPVALAPRPKVQEKEVVKSKMNPNAEVFKMPSVPMNASAPKFTPSTSTPPQVAQEDKGQTVKPIFLWTGVVSKEPLAELRLAVQKAKYSPSRKESITEVMDVLEGLSTKEIDGLIVALAKFPADQLGRKERASIYWLCNKLHTYNPDHSDHPMPSGIEKECKEIIKDNLQLLDALLTSRTLYTSSRGNTGVRQDAKAVSVF